MTIDDFLKKYNRCPFCQSYKTQGHLCDNCKFRYPGADGDDTKFNPTPEWGRMIDKEVTDWE